MVIDIDDAKKLFISLSCYDRYGRTFKNETVWMRREKNSLANVNINFLPQGKNAFNVNLNDTITNSKQITFKLDGLNKYGIKALQVWFNNSGWINLNNQLIHTLEIKNNFGLSKFKLKSIDVNNHEDLISKNLLIENNEPKLTGKSMRIFQNNNQIIIDYKDVFNGATYYLISAGSIKGSKDLLDEIESKETKIKFTLKNIFKLYVNIYGISKSGKSIFLSNSLQIQSFN